MLSFEMPAASQSLTVPPQCVSNSSASLESKASHQEQVQDLMLQMRFANDELFNLTVIDTPMAENIERVESLASTFNKIIAIQSMARASASTSVGSSHCCAPAGFFFCSGRVAASRRRHAGDTIQLL